MCLFFFSIQWHLYYLRQEIYSPVPLLDAPVQQLISTNFYSPNHMAATEHISACRHDQDDLLLFKKSIRERKTDDWGDFECGMVAGARRVCLSISETADLICVQNATQWISHITMYIAHIGSISLLVVLLLFSLPCNPSIAK